MKHFLYGRKYAVVVELYRVRKEEHLEAKLTKKKHQVEIEALMKKQGLKIATFRSTS